MSAQLSTVNITLQPNDNPRLANLCGPFDEHIHQLEERLSVEIRHRGNLFTVAGVNPDAKIAAKILKSLYDATRTEELSKESIHLHLQESEINSVSNGDSEKSAELSIRTRRGVIRPRGGNQAKYINDILTHDLTFRHWSCRNR